jgi:hypothetical protein
MLDLGAHSEIREIFTGFRSSCISPNLENENADPISQPSQGPSNGLGYTDFPKPLEELLVSCKGQCANLASHNP